MGNALVQVVATGPQNVVINGQPEATLFKRVHRRITIFAIESVAQTFTGSVNFGNRVTATISRNGDLLTKMVLEVTLPAISATLNALGDPEGSSNTDTVTVKYVDNIGHFLLREIELEVGGISIVKHYGRWLHIWQELTRPSSKDSVYAKMVGSARSDLSATQAVSDNGVVTATPTSKLYIPLRFWFCDNYAAAFPLIACQYHDVKVNITFESFVNLTKSYITVVAADDGYAVGAPAIASGSLDATLYVDYVFLDNEERRNFATSSHEYLIEQLQYPSGESHSGQSTITRRLDGFNHPVKEIVFVAQLDSVLSTADNGTALDPANFSNGGAQMITSAKLLLNGNDRFSARSGDYFNWVQPYQHHTRGPATGIYVYSFATEPENTQPTGTCNFSRIDTAQLQLTIPTAASKTHVYMVNYNVVRFVSGMCGLSFSA